MSFFDFLSWPFQHNNADSVAGWGFWFGSSGLLMTLIGFGVTWAQLIRTKHATKAVAEEMERIRASLITYDAVQEASKAMYALSVAKRHLKSMQWESTADAYEDFRRALVSIGNNVSTLSDEQRRGIEEASLYIQRLCERIERDLLKNTQTVDYVKTHTRMKQHDQFAFDIQQSIQRSLVS